MAEAAPTLNYEQDYSQQIDTAINYAPTISVPEMQEDIFTRQRAERFIQKFTHQAMQECVSLETDGNYETKPSSFNNLMEAIHAAKDGDPEARKMIYENVRTDVVERTIKTGHLTKVNLETNNQGQLLQFGQTMESVYANALMNTPADSKMMERSQAEARNGFRIENLNRQGVLEDYNFVVFSMAADNMSQAEMKKAGFFTETMSMAIQVTSADGAKLSTETAFVSGKDPGQNTRHDKQAMAKVGHSLGVDYQNKSAAEVINTPILVHKSMMPNGVIDMVKLYDESLGGTFFGEHKKREDYVKYASDCKKREQGFNGKVSAITDEIVNNSHNVWSPNEATKLLHEVSEKHMVDYAIKDETIDAMVFGEKAAGHIQEARQAHKEGRLSDVAMHQSVAEITAESSSCPNATQDKSKAKNGKGSIERMTCPFCKDPNQYGDPCSPNQSCTSCKAMVIGGKVVSRGSKKSYQKLSLIEIYQEIKAKQKSKSNNKKAA